MEKQYPEHSALGPEGDNFPRVSDTEFVSSLPSGTLISRLVCDNFQLWQKEDLEHWISPLYYRRVNTVSTRSTMYAMRQEYQ